MALVTVTFTRGLVQTAQHAATAVMRGACGHPAPVDVLASASTDPRPHERQTKVWLVSPVW